MIYITAYILQLELMLRELKMLMSLDKACDTMITGYPRSQEEDAHSTDERIDVTNP